jgi:hypothetical protein
MQLILPNEARLGGEVDRECHVFRCWALFSRQGA